MIAPLVHAHSSNDLTRFGLHLPSFEIYSTSELSISPSLHSIDYLSSLDDAIVSISTGIKNQQNDTYDLSPLLYFPPDSFSITLTLVSCEINFSPQLLQSSKTFLHSPQSPRAPPV